MSWMLYPILVGANVVGGVGANVVGGVGARVGANVVGGVGLLVVGEAVSAALFAFCQAW